MIYSYIKTEENQIFSTLKKRWFYLILLSKILFWLQFSKLQERVETAESRVSVLETMIDDLQWNIDKIRKREQRLNRHLADVLERVSTIVFTWNLDKWVWFWAAHHLPRVPCYEKVESVLYHLWFWICCSSVFSGFNGVYMKPVAFFAGKFQRLQGVWSWEQSLWGHNHH